MHAVVRFCWKVWVPPLLASGQSVPWCCLLPQHLQSCLQWALLLVSSLLYSSNSNAVNWHAGGLHLTHSDVIYMYRSSTNTKKYTLNRCGKITQFPTADKQPNQLNYSQLWSSAPKRDHAELHLTLSFVSFTAIPCRHTFVSCTFCMCVVKSSTAEMFKA